MARPRKPLLNRELIVAAALSLVDAEGLPALSTRRLAAELGVSGPSLYNHFKVKDDILDAVADTVVSQVDLSMFQRSQGPQGSQELQGGPDWRAALLAWGRSYRAALTAHPNIVPFLAQGPGRRPAGLRMADAVFGAMVDAGWPPAQATRIGALMRYFVAGSALGSFARGFVDDAGAYDPADYPRLGSAHLLAEHQQQVDEGAFETGLRALVDGLAIQYEAGGYDAPHV
ncbi:TetR/AcrR family transcriptional regulator C-terminal domain-containing protein [Streptomyces sp. NPDC006733]|uniref:TetR/AcrR family transcriptional regulator n=1 Tax=Streptomyces sp. NPDC006733 TaxID=3155460 RepID=UPI0034048433